MTIQNRFQKIIDAIFDGNQKAFAEAIGVTPSVINNVVGKRQGKPSCDVLEKIYANAQISMDWLISGKGEMFSQDEPYVSDSKIIETPQIPIVSASLSQKPNTDVLEVVQESTEGMAISKVIVDDAPISIWWRVYDRSLEPEIKMGSKIALVAYQNGEEDPTPGCLYGIDTYTKGLILRRLYPHPNGYIARSYNPTEYPDMIIPHDNIIRIYRAILEVRRL